MVTSTSSSVHRWVLVCILLVICQHAIMAISAPINAPKPDLATLSATYELGIKPIEVEDGTKNVPELNLRDLVPKDNTTSDDSDPPPDAIGSLGTTQINSSHLCFFGLFC